MTLIKCPECGQKISDKAKKCVHCGKVLSGDRPDTKICIDCGKENSIDATECIQCGCPFEHENVSTILQHKEVGKIGKKKGVAVICIIIILVIIFGFVKSMRRSPYYIKLPQNSQFKKEAVALIPEEDGELIKKFIPAVIKWYNSVDITKEQSTDFVPDDIYDMGEELYGNDIYKEYLATFIYESKTDEEKEAFEEINNAGGIFGAIAGVMMNSTMKSSETGSDDVVLIVNEEDWKELQTQIKEAVEYYYR